MVSSVELKQSTGLVWSSRKFSYPIGLNSACVSFASRAFCWQCFLALSTKQGMRTQRHQRKANTVRSAFQNRAHSNASGANKIDHTKFGQTD